MSKVPELRYVFIFVSPLQLLAHPLSFTTPSSLLSLVAMATSTSNPSTKTVGETSLSTLLSTLEPILHDPTYFFLTLPSSTPIPSTLQPLMTFRESEGTTLILTEPEVQEHNLKSQAIFPCKMITLNVHSSLEAVGFLAVVATALKKRGMGVNPVAGYYHDHLFIPVGMEADAVKVLEELRKEASEGKVDW